MGKEFRIIFFGTPDFAKASLKKLVDNQVNIVAVITAPDRPKGRGKKLTMSAVKEYALEAELPVLQPTNLKSPDFIKELADYNANLQIIVAFRMLPVAVWDMPSKGTFNLHASLLPHYRGAAPINWVIINGETETGITTFFLDHEIDTGKIIYQEKEPIEEDDNAGSLYLKLMSKGAALVLKTVRAIEKEDYAQISQNFHEELKSAPKIFKEDCKIDWHNTSVNINNFVRGLSPYPAAWTKFANKNLKIYQVEVSSSDINKEIGEFESDGKSYLKVKTADRTLDISDLQLEGKKRMRIEDFLRGYQFTSLDDGIS